MPEREDTRPIKVEVRNLTKRFGDLLVLDNMSFNIRKGEFVCVVGPTGCGKTTFLNCLTRIHMPSEGDLYIDGVPADPRKHNISFVFQEPSALPWLTVEDNLAYGLKIKRIPKAEIDRRVDQILDLMGLQEFRKAYPGELSVSAEQRIIIGRSFAMQPDLLLMDEPTNGLDIPGKSQFRKFLASGMSDDKTIVISTHQVRDIDKVLDHVLIMDNSRVLLDESTASICSKLFFLESDDRELAATALYTLPSVQGNFLMLPNTEGEESEINLELLFGAVLAEPGKIAEMFHTKTNE